MAIHRHGDGRVLAARRGEERRGCISHVQHSKGDTVGTAPPARHSGPAGSPPRYLSLVHLMAGTGSPTELHGSLTSFIHGVVTVPPKEMILAGAWGQGGGQPGRQALCTDPLVCAEG